ncbi:MAG: hypothetical protein KAW41_00245 [Candidatus Diapherotrites archaeon]|nr:hypothetical protein [Candidatus Diapherotrites archaeon]
MKKFFVLALIVLLVGCTQPEATPAPAATPTPTLTGGPSVDGPPSSSGNESASPRENESIPTPTPDPYLSVDVGQVLEKGLFELTIVSVGEYTHTTPFGEEVMDYRVDLGIQNTAGTEEEYWFDYELHGDSGQYPVQWYSPLYAKGVLGAREKLSSSVLYGVGGSKGPFKLLVRSIPLSRNDYMDVIGENELDKPVVGVINYGDTCGESALADDYLGPLAGTGACGGISAARDWFNYPSWIEEGVVITRLKLKNNAEEPATVFVVDEVPARWGVTARDLSYTHEPIFLDDYHPAWFVRLGRNEIWVTQVNFTTYLEQSEIEALPKPVATAVDYA